MIYKPKLTWFWGMHYQASRHAKQLDKRVRKIDEKIIIIQPKEGRNCTTRRLMQETSSIKGGNNKRPK